jgi:hypothetical protein
MKELLTGKATENGAGKQSNMAFNIMDTMQRYFRDNEGKMGDLETSIINSVNRYFEEPPPKRAA